MADRKWRYVLNTGARQEKVRYGRATLTVQCAVSVGLTQTGEALSDYRGQQATAESVAWTFLKSQTVEHSPTFDWKRVDLAILLPRVTAAMRKPRMKARTADALISELEAVEARERETWTKSTALTRQWVDFFGRTKMDTLIDGEMTKMEPVFAETLRNYTMHLGPRVQAGDAEFFIDSSLLRWTQSFTSSPDVTEALGGSLKTIFKGQTAFDWITVAGQFSEVAKANRFVDAAKAVEVTAEATDAAESAGVDALVEGLQPMFAKLEDAIKGTKDSVGRMILVAVAAALIVLMIQAALARFGIYVEPQTPPAAPPKKAKRASAPRGKRAPAPRGKRAPAKEKAKQAAEK